MAWERRKRGGLYYTRSRRLGKRVIREYFGNGLVAELQAMQDASDRADRLDAQAQLRTEQASARALRASIAALAQALNHASAVELEAAGYHQRRGEWRRRHNS